MAKPPKSTPSIQIDVPAWEAGYAAGLAGESGYQEPRSDDAAGFSYVVGRMSGRRERSQHIARELRVAARWTRKNWHIENCEGTFGGIEHLIEPRFSASWQWGIARHLGYTDVKWLPPDVWMDADAGDEEERLYIYNFDWRGQPPPERDALRRLMLDASQQLDLWIAEKFPG